jgi:gas vesicle protein
MRRIFSFLSGALCGALVGAAGALLFAPMSGIELRQQVQERYNLMLEEGRRAAADRRTELEAQLAALKRPAPAA